MKGFFKQIYNGLVIGGSLLSVLLILSQMVKVGKEGLEKEFPEFKEKENETKPPVSRKSVASDAVTG